MSIRTVAGIVAIVLAIAFLVVFFDGDKDKQGQPTSSPAGTPASGLAGEPPGATSVPMPQAEGSMTIDRTDELSEGGVAARSVVRDEVPVNLSLPIQDRDRDNATALSGQKSSTVAPVGSPGYSTANIPADQMVGPDASDTGILGPPPEASSSYSTGPAPEARDTGILGLPPEAGELGIQYGAPEGEALKSSDLPPEASDPGTMGPGPEDSGPAN